MAKKKNPGAPMNKQDKWTYTWHMVKVNKACYGLLAPFMFLFIIFTIIPVVMSLPIGFTNFNMVQAPEFVGLSNFYTLFLNDDVFLIAVRNTLIFAIFTGPFSYILSFFIAWLINEMNPFFKTFFTCNCTPFIGEGNGTPLQYSCLENPMDGGAWWAAVHGVAKSQTRLSDFTFTFHFHALEKEMATHSSVLAWRIPGTGEPGGLPSMGSHRVGHD